MEQERLETMLHDLADATEENAPQRLADRIKQNIPEKLGHRKLDGINIVIDFRVNRLAAAAAIIVTMVLCIGLLGGGDGPTDMVYEGKMLFQYLFGQQPQESSRADLLELRYRTLQKEGNDVVFYPEYVDTADSNTVLLQMKLPDGSFRIITGNLKEREVTAEELIELQSKMLQNRQAK